MNSLYRELRNSELAGPRYDMPDNAYLMPGRFIEITNNGLCDRLWRCASLLLKDPTVIAFAVLFKDNKQFFPSDLLWMEFNFKESKYVVKKALPISALRIVADEKEKTIAISTGPGKFHRFQLYGPTYKKNLGFFLYEGLNIVKHPIPTPRITEKLLNKFTFNNPTLTPEIDGVDIGGYMDARTEISLIKTSCFLKHWTENDLSSSPKDKPLLLRLRATYLFNIRGIFYATVNTGKYVYPRKAFVVVDEISSDLIIGMNILQDMYPELADPKYF